MSTRWSPATAIGLALVENGFRVLYTRATDLVQRLQVARRELALESAIRKLDKYHLLILDLCEAAGYVELGPPTGGSTNSPAPAAQHN